MGSASHAQSTRPSTGSHRLNGRRAFITGGGSGIGRAVAVRYAMERARVAIMGRRIGALEQTAAMIRDLGGDCLVVSGDVSSEDDMSRNVETVLTAWGGLDIVVGVAGVEYYQAGDAPVHKMDVSMWRQTIDINLTGMFLTCKHGIRALLGSGGGSVIVTGSPCGSLGVCSDVHAYSASKAGCHGLVRPMANAYAADGIRVNCVIPGFIDTSINAPIMVDPGARASLESTIPMQRAGQPEEVAGLYAWLASDEASYVTGAFFVADGGMTAV